MGDPLTKRILYRHSTEFLPILQILAVKEFTTSGHGGGNNQRIVEGELKVAGQHDRLGM
jgi:hypothetical protein